MIYKLEGLNELSKQLSDFQERMGFTDSNVTQRLMLAASEIFEAFEAFRKDDHAMRGLTATGTIEMIEKPYYLINEQNSPDYWKRLFEQYVKDSMEDELADAVIRLLAFCGENNIDIEKYIALKMEYNELRGFKYGGKKF